MWWRCRKCGYEWQATPATRSHGCGCAQCAGKLATPSTCLLIKRPNVAAEWHPSKNGKLTPVQVTEFSNKKVYWLCERDHVWRTSINNRSHGSNCPYCAGKAVCRDNSLLTLNSKLAQEWHPTKNKLSADKVRPFSGFKVWWKCSNGHEWQAVVAKRSAGRGCPKCYKSSGKSPRSR
ncbi:MAG: hypothetical protein DME24_17680 [Verrucomicrobia bacterium]|nr:MAG: hypothetical protein DME24_17680 [Verrucomicrobiota bacterium]